MIILTWFNECASNYLLWPYSKEIPLNRLSTLNLLFVLQLTDQVGNVACPYRKAACLWLSCFMVLFSLCFVDYSSLLYFLLDRKERTQLSKVIISLKTENRIQIGNLKQAKRYTGSNVWTKGRTLFSCWQDYEFRGKRREKIRPTM